jgi:hypothetical protein
LKIIIYNFISILYFDNFHSKCLTMIIEIIKFNNFFWAFSSFYWEFSIWHCTDFWFVFRFCLSTTFIEFSNQNHTFISITPTLNLLKESSQFFWFLASNGTHTFAEFHLRSILSINFFYFLNFEKDISIFSHALIHNQQWISHLTMPITFSVSFPSFDNGCSTFFHFYRPFFYWFISNFYSN